MSIKNRLDNFQVHDINLNDGTLNKLRNIIKDLENRIGQVGEVNVDDVEMVARKVIPKFRTGSLELTVFELKKIISLFRYELDNRSLSDEYENIEKMINYIDLVQDFNSKQSLFLRFLKCLNEIYGMYPEKIKKEIMLLHTKLSEKYKKSKKYIAAYMDYPIYGNGVRDICIEIEKCLKQDDLVRPLLRSLLIPMSDNQDNYLNVILDEYLNLVSHSYKDLGWPEVHYGLFIHPVESEELQFKLKTDKMITSLLSPFEVGIANADIQKKTVAFIDRYVGDPRFYSSRWVGVDQKIKQLYLGWKTKISMEIFFDLISSGSDLTERGQKHWDDRRSYWKWFLDKGLISEAWVVLGTVAEQSAEKFFSDIDSPQYGTGNLRPDGRKSHIMIKIQNIIIIECSHNGAIWIYDENNKNCPRLYGKQYHADDFSRATGDSYLGHQGPWHSLMDERIESKTNLNITKIRRGY